MGLVFLNNEEVRGYEANKEVKEVFKNFYKVIENNLIEISEELKAYKLFMNRYKIHETSTGNELQKNIENSIQICITLLSSFWARVLAKYEDTTFIEIEYSNITEYIITDIKTILSEVPKELINLMIDFKELFNKYDIIFKILIT